MLIDQRRPGAKRRRRDALLPLKFAGEVRDSAKSAGNDAPPDGGAFPEHQLESWPDDST